MAMHHKISSFGKAPCPPLYKLWMLRVLVLLDGHMDFVNKDGFQSYTLAATVGLDQWCDTSDENFNVNMIRKKLTRLHKSAESGHRNAPLPEILNRNIVRLAELADLNLTEQKILGLIVAINTNRDLRNACKLLEGIQSNQIPAILAVIIEEPEDQVRISLSNRSTLIRSGLISINHANYSLDDKLDLLERHFADRMTTLIVEPEDLLRKVVSKANPPLLRPNDFSHIQSILDIATTYLRNAIATKKSGVNIFIHGSPGTGKTQLARVLNEILGFELFEVSNEDSDGDPVDGECRLRALRAAQTFFTQRRAIIAFDEAEDVFHDGDIFFGRKSTAQLHKSWINRMLEDNPIPTLWLSNSIRGIDPAFIRRFDMVFELPIPPKKQREHILRQSCNDLLDEARISRMAEVEHMAPAVITRAGNVARALIDELGQQKATAAFELLIGNTLEAQGHPPLQLHDANRLPDIYDPQFVNADVDLTSLAEGLLSTRSARLCLYGPPGTGKTAYGRWLSQQLAMPLHVKRASDLMSPFVGMTEQHMASAFREAAQGGSLLLIDEVDSFLQDRRGAQRSWEVSQVNEMLTQMESFPGVFIASTNLMDGLDQAALRRFDLKVKFDFLRAEQAGELLRRYCVNLNLPAPQPESLARISRLRQLTPGDFAAVARQHRFRPLKSAAAMVAALEAECAIKQDRKSTIGFLS